MDELNERADDLENRGRRKNIRIIGLPEGVEGTNPAAFLKSWLPKVLHIGAKMGRMKLEQAHRTLPHRPSPTQRPKPVLARFHNYQDKQRIMKASWELGRKNQSVKR